MVGAACCTDYSRRLPNCVKPRLSFRIPRLRHVFVLTLSHFTCLEKPMDHLSCALRCARHYLHIYPYQYPQQVHKNSILWPRHNKVNKGSRQIQSVTSGKRLALSVARWNNLVAF